MAPKRKFNQYNTYQNQVQYEQAEITPKRSINSYTEGDKAFQAVLTLRDEDPLVGIQKMYYDEKHNVWKHTKKCVFMGQDAWEAFALKFHEIKEAFEAQFNEPPSKVKNIRPPPPEFGTCSSSSSSTTKN